MIEADFLPFFVTAPGDSDILFTAVIEPLFEGQTDALPPGQ